MRFTGDADWALLSDVSRGDKSPGSNLADRRRFFPTGSLISGPHRSDLSSQKRGIHPAKKLLSSDLLFLRVDPLKNSVKFSHSLCELLGVSSKGVFRVSYTAHVLHRFIH